MAKNTDNGSRSGAVTGRTLKQDGGKFKGVATEPDGRRTKK